MKLDIQYSNIILLIYFIPEPNVSYFHNNSSTNTHSQKQHNKKRKILQGEKTGVLLFMNYVRNILYNTSISYLHGLFITIIFLQ